MAFVAAYSAYDADAAAGFLAEDADLTNLIGSGDWQLGVRWMEATAFRVLPLDCELSNETASSTLVGCFFDYHGLRSEEVGLGPFENNSFQILISGSGEITDVRWTLDYLNNGFSTQVWEPFADWIMETHPGDVAALYADGAGQTLERVSEDSIPLWEQRTQEWVQVVNEG
jgi:hypothetical protein